MLIRIFTVRFQSANAITIAMSPVSTRMTICSNFW